MPTKTYRSLPINPTRFYLVRLPGARRACWLKVDDCGKVIEASPKFCWALDMAIEQVDRWCKSKNLLCRALHGNIKNVTPYL